MEDTNKGKKIIIIGFVSIVILFLMYARYQDPEVFTPSALESIQRIGSWILHNNDYFNWRNCFWNVQVSKK